MAPLMEQVDPTNNLAERIVRQAVLWRKSSFGRKERSGCVLFGAYIDGVCNAGRMPATRGRSIIAYLREEKFLSFKRHSCSVTIEAGFVI